MSSQKRKGTRVENEIVKLFIKEGFKARRQPLSGAIQDFPHDVRVADLFGGTTVEVKARKSGGGFTQLDRWKGSADLLILKRDFKEPMVYMSWNLYKEYLNEYKENRSGSESGEQTTVRDQLSGQTEIEEDRQKSTPKIPSRPFGQQQGMRQAHRKSWPNGKRKIAKRVHRKGKVNGSTQLQTRWDYLKGLSKK
jgi:hypothetical protein